MFGWLKSLFGSEPAQKPVVVPPLPPKVKKTVKKVEKPSSKKTEVKVKAPKAPRKKKEEAPIVNEVSTTPVVDATVTTELTTKKKGGRPKKSS